MIQENSHDRIAPLVILCPTLHADPCSIPLWEGSHFFVLRSVDDSLDSNALRSSCPPQLPEPKVRSRLYDGNRCDAAASPAASSFLFERLSVAAMSTAAGSSILDAKPDLCFNRGGVGESACIQAPNRRQSSARKNQSARKRSALQIH